MGIWKGLKKFFIADLSATQNDTFSLGKWEGGKETGPSQANDYDQYEEERRAKVVVSANLDQNIEWIKGYFSYPRNQGLVVRRLALGQTTLQGAVLYMDGQVKWEAITQTILTPLISMYIPNDEMVDEEYVLEHILTEGQISTQDDLEMSANSLLFGNAVILVDGWNKAVQAGIQGYEKKAIENPKTETVVRGSQVGFTEDIHTNVSLVRRRLRTRDLMIEWSQAGEHSQTDIAIVYLKSIANEELVQEVRKRIDAIEYDYIGDSGMIEQMIEDHPNGLYPSILSTERPDRVSAQIAEGYVGILVNNSPFGLIVPAHFQLFLQTSEDANLRWPYSSFIRIIRHIGYFLAIYLPAVYVAIANFHMEMIPTTLLLAIAGTRETVPLPLVAETILLESMFELIREAGVRIPGVIGPTIGIVGALILGQAAVQANIVSPIVVIITATTALSSYTIPNYNLQFSTRILRFAYLIAASVLGLVGIILIWLILLAYRLSSKSFGVPALSPISPYLPSADTIIRAGMKWQKYRPLSVRPKKREKMSAEKGESQEPTINREEV